MGFWQRLFGGGSGSSNQGSGKDKKTTKTKTAAANKPTAKSAATPTNTSSTQVKRPGKLVRLATTSIVPEEMAEAYKLIATAKMANTEKIDVQKRFQFLSEAMGQGSMSKVYRVVDRKSGRTGCLKILDLKKTDDLKKRFVNMPRPDEGEVALRLDHPNIVQTYEYGYTRNKEEYLFMEYVEGYNLSFLIDSRSKLLVGRELEVLIQAAEALAYFHKMGYIHRDICPRNIMVTNEGIVKLIDFGLAVPDTPEFRKPGNRTGTAAYMAPELIRRSKTDQRIDVFSFGVTCYEVFTYNLPWESGQSIEAIMAHLNHPPKPPRDFNPQISLDTQEVLLRSIERDPNHRYQSMRHLIKEFKRLRGDADWMDYETKP